MGLVTGVIKGGLEVDIEGLRAFAPASHVALHHGSRLGELIGQRLDFYVTQYAKRGQDVVLREGRCSRPRPPPSARRP